MQVRTFIRIAIKIVRLNWVYLVAIVVLSVEYVEFAKETSFHFPPKGANEHVPEEVQTVYRPTMTVPITGSYALSSSGALAGFYQA